MFKIRQVIKGIGLLLSCALLVAAIVFAEARQVGRTCQAIDIAIIGNAAQQFVEKEELLKQLTANNCIPIVGKPLQALVTRQIENTIKCNNFVRRAIAYKSWKGSLKIAVTPRRAIARMLYAHQPSQYIDEEGVILPLSDHYTARVLLIEIERLSGVSRNLQESIYGRALLDLLTYIDREPLWRSQIVHMCIDQQGKITMHTQISKQRVELGKPESIEKKFTKLQLFYKKIIPYKGWNTYGRVNLEFANQILCE